ncbi:MAG TPA: hypothetical protein PLK34_02495 [Candidatus Pacearchaeota archaeon]|nr:hypothetical protein [Candidatus Pacearchaeota archaeon]
MADINTIKTASIFSLVAIMFTPIDSQYWLFFLVCTFVAGFVWFVKS